MREGERYRQRRATRPGSLAPAPSNCTPTPRHLVIVHASMRRVGVHTDELLRALLSVLGPDGTLAAYVDFEPTPTSPTFDVHLSPAATAHGVLAEAVRRWPGACRSSNPGASFAAIGGGANWLCAEHPLKYGYGPGSPLARLVETGGKVLLLGSDFDHVTLLHYAEHVARLPGKRVIRCSLPVAGGALAIEEYDTSDPVIDGMPQLYFDEIVRGFVLEGNGRSGRVGGAESRLFSAAALARYAVDKMEREFGGSETLA